MPTATNDGVRLHWDEGGTGDPILLVMGHGLPSTMWYPVLPALTARHRVVWFDHRGTGDSDATRTSTVADLAADARAVMDAAGLDRAHVWGISMGGAVALQLAYESPERVRSLVLGCTAMRTPALIPMRVAATLVRSLPYRMPRRLTLLGVRLTGYGPAAPPTAVERDLEVLAGIRFSPGGVYAQSRALPSYAMTPERVATLAMPALVQHGTADQAVPVREGARLARTLPNGRLITYPGAGHNYIVACAEQAGGDVLRFLADGWA